MFATKTNEDLSSQFISPNSNPKEYDEEVKKLLAEKIKLPKRASIMIERQKSGSTIVHQKDKKLGSGSFGTVYLYKATESNLPDKVIKEDKEHTLAEFLPGLKDELKKTIARDTCHYETLTSALLYTERYSDYHEFKDHAISPKAIQRYLEEFIQTIEESVQHRMNSLLKENNFINEVYGDSILFSEQLRLSMLFLDGETLRDRLKKPITLLQGLDLFFNIVSAYSMLAACRIAQIDVKSDNMLISKEGEITPCDFGLAKKHGTFIKAYFNPKKSPQMAPEIHTGTTVDQRLDIYGLGRTLDKITTWAIKSSTKREYILINELNNMRSEMRETDPKKRTITFKEIHKRILASRTACYPDEEVLIPKLHPIFKKKMLALEQEEAQESRSLKP